MQNTNALEARVTQLEGQVSALLDANTKIVNALRQMEQWIVNASRVITQQADSGEQGQ